MNRYLLDTNILVFILFDEWGEISKEVENILKDYYSNLSTSSLCIAELIHLCRIGKLALKRGKSVTKLIESLNGYGIEIDSFTKKHIKNLTDLETVAGHNDPNDFAIISQALTDRYILISSDSKFKHYKNQKLNFVYNKR